MQVLDLELGYAQGVGFWQILGALLPFLDNIAKKRRPRSNYPRPMNCPVDDAQRALILSFPDSTEVKIRVTTGPPAGQELNVPRSTLRIILLDKQL